MGIIFWFGPGPAASVFGGASTNADSSAAGPKVPDLRELMASFKTNEMRAVAQRYQADRGNLTRFYNVPIAPERCVRLRSFGEDWLAAVQRLDPGTFSEDARAERTRLLETIRRDLRQVEDQARAQAELAPLLPFGKIILDLDGRRRRVEKVDARQIAGAVDDLAKSIVSTRKIIEEQIGRATNHPGAPVRSNNDPDREAGRTQNDQSVRAPAAADGESSHDVTDVNASRYRRAADSVDTLRTALKSWFNFYNDYDPLFSWWVVQPYKEADKALNDYAVLLEKKSEDEPAADASKKDLQPAPMEPPNLGSINFAGKTTQVPDLKELIAAPQSRMRAAIERYQGNRNGRAGFRRGGSGRPHSKDYYRDWLAALQKVDFSALTHDDQINYLLLKNRVEYQLRRLDFPTDADEDTGTFVPFREMIEKLNESQSEKFDAARATEFLHGFKRELDDARRAATNQFENATAALANRAGRAARALGGMRGQLQEWRDRNSADWQANELLEKLYKSAEDGIDEYAAYLREKSGGTARRDGSDISGRPIGRDALKVELEAELISYTPEELLAIAEKEFAWCVAEMKRASREMGLGDDWRAALENVKDLHVPVGEQPYLIRDLAREAVDYLEKNDLISIPQIARETWRVQMMSLQRQMVNPFFTGGETISVSYPLSAMSHDQKLQSMRGNNIPFARATVFHELIPGHGLQGFTAARYHTERRPFSTPFYGEGWAVYWELLLYERGFHGSPENRLGALFWRLHRCARIIFSLNFHLEQWKPQQCIDYLVTEVGHERDNATAEVRRSFATSYGPLYQAAYLIGALQLRELRRELVSSGGMTDRAFNDAILKEGSMPIAMLRAILTNQLLAPDYRPVWRFYDSAPAHN